MKLSSQEYLDKVRLLNEEEQERLLSRMGGKLPRRLEKEKLSREEAMAIQMELEDEQLQEWRERMHALKAKSEKSDNVKSKDATVKIDAKPAKAVKPKAAEVTPTEPEAAKKAASAKTVAPKTAKK